MKKSILAPLAAALVLGAFPAMSAVEYSSIEVEAAPPPLRTEVTPAPREGYVWIPGYWDYRDRGYTWVDGHFESARPGYVYVAPRYEEREGRWRMYAGGWDRRDAEEEHGGLRNRAHALKERITGHHDDD
jgi:hypothetical protein